MDSFKRARLKGLYAITDAGLAARQGLEAQVAEALAGGASIVQYRDKSGDAGLRRRQAASLAALCRRAGALLIVNDDVELALSVGADGVHLGRDDPDPVAARKRLGQGAVIGVSCYNRFELARAARDAGADYIAFGRFFPSATKPDAVQADPALLSMARKELDLPAVAIGGITPQNGRALVDAGADMLAVVNGVFGQADIRAACRAFTRLFDKPED